MGWLDLSSAVLVSAIWGGNVVVSKIAIADVPPLFLLGLRFLLVAVIAVPWIGLPRGRWKLLLMLSVTMGVLYFGTSLLGLSRVDASIAAIIHQLQVPFGMLVAVFALGERPQRRQWLGMAVAFGGVIVLVGGGEGQADAVGLGLIVLSSFLWALGSIQMKMLGDMSPMAVNGWLSALAAPQLLSASFVLEDGQWSAIQAASWATVSCVVYLSLVTTLLGYGIWYRLMQKHPVNVVMPFTLTIPAFGVLASSLLLHEALGPNLLAGGVLTAAGVGAIVLTPAPRRGEETKKT